MIVRGEDEETGPPAKSQNVRPTKRPGRTRRIRLIEVFLYLLALGGFVLFLRYLMTPPTP
jgi:hypothetical protein